VHKTTILETDRLILRPLEADDAVNMFEYARDPAVGPNAGWRPHRSVRESQDIIESVFSGKPYAFGMILKKNGRLIGTAGLDEDTHGDGMQLGFALGRRYWGNGYASEACNAILSYAFSELCLDCISAYCFGDNERSERLLIRLGFTFRGMIKNGWHNYDGRTMDECSYSLSCKDFRRVTVCN